jgi:tetratricopeptide (TPR) repeat protein
MRRSLSCSVLIAVCLCMTGRAAELPSPAACASYSTNRTGGDADCDAAIAKESDPAVKSVLLFRRAYMEDALGDFSTYPKALADLDEAIRLEPTNFMALHERAYLYNEYGRWADALKDIDAQIALKPQFFDGYQERAMSRFYLGDLQGAFEDRNTVVMLQPGMAGPLIGRAVAAIWLGCFEAAGKELNDAAGLAAKTGDTDAAQDIERFRADLILQSKTSGKAPASAACTDADKAGDFGRKELIGDCTRAFLDGKTAREKADALTIRATARLVGSQDVNGSTTDYRIAAALDPENAGAHSNVGFAYLRLRHSTAAVWEFDRSIALKPDFYNYAGRAEAKYNLNELDSAIADAKKSLEIKQNDVALIVLGDSYHAKTKSYDEAKKYWIEAYRMGDRGDDLIARLKEAGVPIPPPEEEPAKPAK